MANGKQKFSDMMY